MNPRVVLAKLAGCRYRTETLLASLLFLGTTSSWTGVNYEVVRSFGSSDQLGHFPEAPLIEGSDGSLYGTTSERGATYNGTVFKANKDGSGFVVLHEFPNFDVDSGSPRAGLIEGSDGRLYGTTANGGYASLGSVFRINKDGGDYLILHDFEPQNHDGMRPKAGVIEGSDGLLYGTTQSGGSAGTGMVYRLAKDGNNYRSLHSFSGSSGDGTSPLANLVEGSDGALYGTTYSGGSSGQGIVFRISKDGSDYTILHHFLGSPGDARRPRSELLKGSDGVLYGTTEAGGSADGGTVFKIKQDGSDYSILHDFLGVPDDGMHPNAGLIEGSDGILYGTAVGAGRDMGTVFRLAKDGSEFHIVRSFLGATGDGRNIRCRLVEGSDGSLYGTAREGGNEEGGVIWKVGREGGGYGIVRHFSRIFGDAIAPEGELIEGRDGFLYGTSAKGGQLAAGAVFKLSKDGSNETILYSFDIPGSGEDPEPGLIEGSDGVLYGTRHSSEQISAGTAFRLNRDGSGFTVIMSFDAGSPLAALMEASDGYLYGTTCQGGSGLGTVFRFNKSGGGFPSYYFNPGGSDGACPKAPVIEASNGVLYGTTSSGGANFGTIFTAYRQGNGGVIHRFAINEGDGRYPLAGLVEASDGFLYGTTSSGGSGGSDGSVFKVGKDGSGYSVLHSFKPIFDGRFHSEGAAPRSRLLEGRDGYLYGTTPHHIPQGNGLVLGTAFRLKKDGTGYEVLHTFDDLAGPLEYLMPGLIECTDGKFYGTTRNGGRHGWGTVFRFSLTRPPSPADDLIVRDWGSPLQIPVQTLLINDSDPQGSLLALSSFSSTSLNGATITQTGSNLVYTPPSGLNLNDWFTYTITNAFGDSALATVTVAVRGTGPDETPDQVLAISRQGSGLRLLFGGTAGLNYLIETADTLPTTNWSTIATATASPVGLFSYEDPAVPGQVQRYYRTRRAP